MKNPQIPWKRIVGMRETYSWLFGIDHKLVWDVIKIPLF